MSEFDPTCDLDITGLDHAELLAALYNGTSPVGLGFLQATPGPMTAEQAAAYLEQVERSCRANNIPPCFRIGYLRGRPIKVELDGDVLRRADLYDRDAKTPAAVIVAALRDGVGI
jgi:hypothetical protein